MKRLKQWSQDFFARERLLPRLFLLTLLKESYLLAKNSYGFLVHPFLTANKIKREKDFSQGILFFGLPVLGWFFWVMVLLSSRLFISQELKFGFLAKGSFLAISFFCALVFAYLFYWFYRALKRK